MSWILDFIGIAIIGLFCLYLPFALIGIGVHPILAGILGLFICAFLWHLFLNRGGQKRLKSYEEWKKIANEMGLEEVINCGIPQVRGCYRNHSVKILGDPRSGVVDFDDQRHLKTLYIIEFRNQYKIQIYLKKRLSLAVIFHGHDSLMSYLKELKTGEYEFDEKFMIRGNSEMGAKAILDRALQKKIIDAKFNEAEIGYTAFWSDEKSQNSIPKWIRRFPLWALSEKRPNEINIQADEAHYIDIKTLDTTKQDPKGFKIILDAMIDIVEKIESFSPT